MRSRVLKGYTMEKALLTPLTKLMEISPLENVVREMCTPESLIDVWHKPAHNAPMPCLDTLNEIIQRLQAAIFPGFFGTSQIRLESLRYHLAANLDSIYHLLAGQIRSGACFACAGQEEKCTFCQEGSQKAAMAFMQKIPEIRRILASDARAAFEGDPAATSAGETIFCYPSMLTMMHHRIAHELYKLGVPVIPRIISELAHSRTGIDIHPGATIGEDFFIDHGTGVVIGETCIIGRHCRIYQGVTLGALSFPKDGTGTLIKGRPRHPILENDVIVYAGATILGRITIGQGAIIGGNVWVTNDVPAGSRVVQEHVVRNGKPLKGE